MSSDHSDFKTTALDRRKLLSALGLMGASMLVGQACSNTGFTTTNTDSTTDSTDTSSGTTGSEVCSEAANETNGPFPADGSNSAGDGNSARLDYVYSGSPILRKNIIDGQTGGIPLTLNITLENTKNSCAVLSGYYVYIWHCTIQGQYSAYTGSGNGTHSRTETYFRGIQQADSNGVVTFETVYPGWYNGRAVHIHVEIYKNIDDANPIKTTQIAFPTAVTQTVNNATSFGYKGTNGMLYNNNDNIFSDGTNTQMLSVTGSNLQGYTGSIVFGVTV